MKSATSPCAVTRRNQCLKINLARWLLPAIALLVALGSAHAADLVWIGGTGNWNAAGNWNPAQVPTHTDNAFITNVGTYTVTVPAGTTATAGSLTVGGAQRHANTRH